MSDTQLLCTFTFQSKIEDTIADILNTYDVARNKIFVLENMRDPEEVFCTYNVKDTYYDSYLDKTISIHRKRETNTLYTINALNQLIKYLNDGVLDEEFPIPWSDYENSLLVTNSGDFQKIDTQLYDIVEIEDEEESESEEELKVSEETD